MSESIWWKVTLPNHSSLDSFTREIMDTVKKHPDTKTESKARMVEEGGHVWFSVVLLYDPEVKYI